jgi:hypothetical protein
MMGSSTIRMGSRLVTRVVDGGKGNVGCIYEIDECMIPD